MAAARNFTVSQSVVQIYGTCEACRTGRPATAAEGVAFLDRTYRRWHEAIAALDEDGLTAPLGPKGGSYAEDPMAGLIVHINREVMHHGAEIALLRDLYRATGASSRDSRLVPRP